MNLSDKDVEEFQQIWKKECGFQITPSIAKREAEQLIELYTILSRNVARIQKEDQG